MPLPVRRKVRQRSGPAEVSRPEGELEIVEDDTPEASTVCVHPRLLRGVMARR